MRVFHDCHRIGRFVGVEFPKEFRLSLYLGGIERVLATVAHDPFPVSKGLPLHPIRREQRVWVEGFIPVNGYHAFGRVVAWGVLELCFMGRDSRSWVGIGTHDRW